MNNIIYMDNAATTRTHPEVVSHMQPYFSEIYGNPSSIYSFSDECRNVIEGARKQLAASINAEPENIYFTNGGSESDNWALMGTARAYKKKGRHIITSKIEHHAILHTCEALEREGFNVTYVNVDENGIVKLDELIKAIRPDTILISIMFANNEIGSLQPIKKIGEIARKHGVWFHTDAVQAYGHVPIDVKELKIDMLSASGHKFNGPKGTGFLYISDKMNIENLIYGGGQEKGKRAGTENVPGIAGLFKASQLAVDSMGKRAVYEKNLRDYMIRRIMNEIPFARVNGHMTNRLPNNANFSFQFVEGESLLIMLDMQGICASTGSACTSSSKSPSHVLTAIGLPEDIASGSLRLTISHETTKKEIDIVCNALSDIIKKLRSMSPEFDDFKKRQGK